jgi:hypothetical protein
LRPELLRYLRNLQFRCDPLVPGENDCLTFTDGAWRAMYGRGWATDWRGKYAADGQFLGRKALVAAFGFESILDAIDDRLERVPHVPPFGALVAAPGRGVFGQALGICTGHHAAMLGPDGLCRIDIENITASWVDLKWRR